MRVLQINAVYKTKSTGRIVMEMHKYFQSKGIESYVAYATENTDTSGDPNVIRIGNTIDHKLHALFYRIDNMQGCHSTLSTMLFLHKVRNLAPDIVLTHNLHSNYLNVPLLLTGLKKLGIHIVMDLHDCWFMTGGCYHYTASGCDGWLHSCENCKILGKAAEKKYKINCDVFDEVHPTIVATSRWIEQQARRSLLRNRCDIHMIYDWIDTETFYPRDGDKIRKKYGIGNSIMILGVATGWAPDKGQLEMMSVAKAMPNAKIVLVGNQATQANYPSNIQLIPFTDSKDELAELYSAADVFFNPSKQETFGLVSGEALACGTPLVVYNTTACPEFVTNETGIAVDDTCDIVNAVEHVLRRNRIIGRETVQKQCRAFAVSNFLMKNKINEYIDLFNTIINL